MSIRGPVQTLADCEHFASQGLGFSAAECTLWAPRPCPGAGKGPTACGESWCFPVGGASGPGGGYRRGGGREAWKGP